MTFEEYVTARGAALVRLAFVLTGSQAAAEDLVQTALADLLPRWGRVE
jgi:DNA-directed RNA polymerase specialized sigma24 family protein